MVISESDITIQIKKTAFDRHINIICLFCKGSSIELTTSKQTTHVRDWMQNFLLLVINEMDVGLSKNTSSSITAGICKQGTWFVLIRVFENRAFSKIIL